MSHQAGLVVYRICGLIVSLNILTNHVLKILLPVENFTYFYKALKFMKLKR